MGRGNVRQGGDREHLIVTLGDEILASMETISDTANDELSYGRQGPSPESLLRQSNPMVGDARPERFIAASTAEQREALRRLTSDPFVARVEIEWTEGGTGRETYYLARGSTCGFLKEIPGAKFIASLSDLGAIAEFDAGELAEISVRGRERKGRIVRKATFSAKAVANVWDALVSKFEIEGWERLSEIIDAASLRAALETMRAKGDGAFDSKDVVGKLLREIASAEADRLRNRRKAVERIALRDQPVLDKFQGTIFRMPVDRQVILFGPPGSGKTTTLIKRLAQKRTAEALTEEERRLVANFSRERFMDPSSWAMFAPSELLKEYLSRAFNREGVPDDRNVRTWEKERVFLARDVLNILRSGSSGRFQLEIGQSILADETSAGIIRLHDEFSRRVEERLLSRCEDALSGLLASDDIAVKRHALALQASFGRNGKFAFEDLLRLTDIGDDLRDDIKVIDDRVEAETNEILSSIIGPAPEVMAETMRRLPQLGGEDDDSADEDAEDEITQPSRSDPRVVALELLLRGVREHARALASGRRLGGRSAKVIELIGSKMPPASRFQGLGADMVVRSQLRALVQAPRLSVVGIPALYSRFRRQADREKNPLYTGAADSSTFLATNRISPHETDVLILVMLRNARRIIQFARSARSDAVARNDWLARIERRYLAQVFVDEATDLSAVQLACSIELADPRLRSWFATGDPRQRITTHGIAGQDDLDWLQRSADVRIDVRNINIGYRQSQNLRRMADDLLLLFDVASVNTTEASKDELGVGVRPIMVEDLRGGHLTQWLADRIVEVERAIGYLPSIAIFVDERSQIASLAASLHDQLKPYNISVMGYEDGLVVGDEREVRVFDIRHVKGMEFEAVFFVGVDEIAARLPQLFERLIYVGVTRAATYLGITCSRRLPTALHPIRDHFSDGGWS